MPTNRRRRLRKPVEHLVENITEDVLDYLRHGLSPTRTPGDPPISDLLGNIVWFWSAKQTLAWLQKTWRKHEALICQGCDSEPYIIRKMQGLRKLVGSGRNYEFSE